MTYTHRTGPEGLTHNVARFVHGGYPWHPPACMPDMYEKAHKAVADAWNETTDVQLFRSGVVDCGACLDVESGQVRMPWMGRVL